MRIRRTDNQRSAVRLRIFLISAAFFLACSNSEDPSLPADPRVILQSHLSHGIGESPLDSPLIHDPVAAAMILRARECVPAVRLQRLAEDSAHGSRLLEQLSSGGLIALRDGKACTTFPILMNERRAAYARVTQELAEDALKVLSSDLVDLTRLVDERGWKDWQYHFVWSQLFDSQFAWTEMMQRGLVPPLGRLVAWVIYPDHPFRSGTNYYPDSEIRDYWLMVTWRPDGADTIALIGVIWKTLYEAALEQRSISVEERARLADLGLIDGEGKVQIPVLRDGDPLQDLLRSLALRYIDFLAGRMPSDSLSALLRVDPQYTFAVAYHDISWEVVSRMVDSGLIDTPPALRPGASGTDPSMRGVAALTPVHAPFADLIRAAIESRR